MFVEINLSISTKLSLQNYLYSHREQTNDLQQRLMSVHRPSKSFFNCHSNIGKDLCLFLSVCLSSTILYPLFCGEIIEGQQGFLEGGHLATDVLVSVVEPLIKGDGAIVVGVNGSKVLLPLGKTSL